MFGERERDEIKQLVGDSLKEIFREALTAEMPAIVAGIHAADKVVAEHPVTKQAVTSAVQAVAPPPGTPPTPATTAAVNNAAAAAVANTPATNPVVATAAGSAAQAAVANAPPAKAT